MAIRSPDALDAGERAAQMAFDVETILDELERLERDVRELRAALIEQRIVLDELRNEEAHDEENLIATDGSEAAREALELGVDLARHEEAAVAIVHVIPSSVVAPMDGSGLVGGLPYEPTRDDEAVLDDAVAIADREGVPAVSKLLHGDPATEIVEYADVLGADLIVVGSRGHGALASALLGSVSRGVLARAQRAVLVVRATRVTELAAA